MATEKNTREHLDILAERFAAHKHRHPDLVWEDIRERLLASPEKLQSLQEMEATGGEPDVIGYEPGERVYLFCDCAKESPAGRRNLCYDRAALDARKEHKPQGNAMDQAAAMGIALLDEAQYRALQALEPFDTKTSSWIRTPEPIRALGGALFGDRRYDHVFFYHNGADSYYSVRGFRGILRV